MSDKIEQMIDEIHDMLIEYMNEDAASPILNKVRELSDFSGNEGYALGSEETAEELDGTIVRI